MKIINFKTEIIGVGTIDEIFQTVYENKKNIYYLSIKEKEPLTEYDVSKEPQYTVKIIYKGADIDETKI